MIPTVKRKLFALDFDFSFGHHDILDEFVNEDWHSPAVYNPLNVDLWAAQRFKLMSPGPQSKILTALQTYLGSNEVKFQFIKTMFDHIPDLAWEYDATVESMFEETNLHAEFSKDLPGFVNCLHTDFRKLVATGMIYFCTEDTEDLCTTFYDTMHRDNPLPMHTGFGKGWWHANGNDTWHEGWNRTKEDRYTCLLGLTLNVVKGSPLPREFQRILEKTT